MAKRGVPIIHLYNVRQMWAAFELPLNPIPLPGPGSGGIFVREKYNVVITWIAVALLSAMIVLAGYFDRKKHKLGTEFPVIRTEVGHEL
jgi:hypothetical protein